MGTGGQRPDELDASSWLMTGHGVDTTWPELTVKSLTPAPRGPCSAGAAAVADAAAAGAAAANAAFDAGPADATAATALLSSLPLGIFTPPGTIPLSTRRTPLFRPILQATRATQKVPWHARVFGAQTLANSGGPNSSLILLYIAADCRNTSDRQGNPHQNSARAAVQKCKPAAGTKLAVSFYPGHTVRPFKMQLHDAGKPEANPYEEERRQRIMRNQAVLQNLGLIEHPLGARAAQQPQQRRAAERQQCEPAAAEAAEPKRRSRRLRGEHVELPTLQRFADEQEK